MNRRRFCLELLGVSVVCHTLTPVIQAAPPLAPLATPKLRWFQNLKTAHKLAVQQDKPLLIVFGASWCTFCHKLERETLGDKRMIAAVERDFIPVHLDFDRDAKVYATVPSPGTIDAALAYYTRDLRMRLPLRELFAADLPQRLKGDLGSARLVGEETVAGVGTEHVAFRDKMVDVQLWIARDGDPLPQRIVITYRLAAGQPQFQADFHGWTLTPDVPDSAFTFVPPPDAERIPIRTPERGRETSEKQP